MIDIYWFEQTVADVPPADDWLSASERDHLNSLRFPKRRADWLLGRWTAKNAVIAYLARTHLGAKLEDIELRPTAAGAPEIFIFNRRSAVDVSLSHRAGRAACALAGSQTAIGCDLELVEPRSSTFVNDYFTAEEQQMWVKVAKDNRDWLAALLWSAKESALKALQVGLRLDTRCLSVKLDPFLVNPETSFRVPFSGTPKWLPLEIRSTSGDMFRGWWQYSGVFVRTLTSVQTPAPPVLLQRSCSMAQLNHLSGYTADHGVKMMQGNH